MILRFSNDLVDDSTILNDLENDSVISNDLVRWFWKLILKNKLGDF